MLMFASALALSACSGNDDYDARIRVEGIDSPTPDPARVRDAAVTAIYTSAQRKDEQALLGLRTQQIKAGETPDPATALALFTIDQSKYGRMFVEEYPESFQGVADEYGRLFGVAGLEPNGSAFPIDRLGDFAAAGDPDAQRKLIEGLTYAVGSPVERDYLAQLERIAQTEPAATLAALSSVPVPARLGAISETDWCYHPPRALLAAQPTSPPNATQVASEFGSDLSAMCKQLAQAAAPQKRRRVHRGKHPAKAHKR
jgi:hypothetical protein